MIEEQLLIDSSVYLARTNIGKLHDLSAESGPSCSGKESQAIPDPYSDNSVRSSIEQLFADKGWDSENTSTLSWNPFGTLIRAGDNVVIKPNWVHHENYSGQSLDCLVTHASVLGAVLDFVLRAKPGKVVVGDAPIQSCDLSKLMEKANYNILTQSFMGGAVPISWHDFRRTVVANSKRIFWDRQICRRPLDSYIMFDLGADSLLESIVQDASRFRVSMYNPDLICQAHAPGRHQYLVAREVIEANVVINLPKLKTHMKACVSGALKNLVGIIGDKNYLPHFRLGGSQMGGDCYRGLSLFKWTAERLRDAAYRQMGLKGYLLQLISKGCHGLSWLACANRNLDGNWYGNDTVWRSCLDLNRILFYGRPDGSFADVPQRKVLTLTDAIVCGEGDGPLAAVPHQLNILTLATNPVAADYVHANLMGFDWRKIPIIREAFGKFKYPLCTFTPEDVRIHFISQWLRQPWPHWNERRFMPPAGWKGHCER